VGADTQVCPYSPNDHPSLMDKSLINDEPSLMDKSLINDEPSLMDKSLMMGEHIGSPLQAVVQWFKTMTTNEYIRNVKSNDWKRFDGKLWQRNYWEHIIRNEKSYQNISEYIINNPTKWIADKLNPNNISK
ncbi:MAG TPA: transposase, partial [Dysgonamonadaceae bacterium]|nr:transposase [Dysgonamonadaceae bacterium]